MHHDRQPQRIGSLARETQRLATVRPDCRRAHSDLDANHKVPIALDRPAADSDVTVLEPFGLVIDAHEPDGRDMHESEHSNPGPLGDELTESREADRASRARVYPRRHARPGSDRIRIDSPESGASEDVGMEVDKAREHQEPRRVNRRSSLVSRQMRADRDDFAVADRDVGWAVQTRPGIENGPAPNGPIVLHQPVPVLRRRARAVG